MLKDKEIEPKTRTIKDYFESCKNNFVIPAYQREYSWGIYNCDKLWQDIIDQVNMDSENKRSHFFGTIIINCSDDKLELIDGQQRTVTFILLLKALLIRINIAILRTPTNDEVSEQLLDNLRRKRKELISILYNMDEDKVPLKPDENKDSELFNKSPILVSKSLSEKYFDDFRTILKSSNFNSIESKVITRK